MSARLLLLLALIVTAVLYAPGLTGPFLLDDHAVLAPVELWVAGRQTWQETLLPNAGSFLFSRPVAMASFMLTAALGWGGALPYKLGNLVLHLAAGVLIWALLRRLLAKDPALAPNAATIATAATVVWLLHPLHVSTVLYAVQRMAQLSTLFTLAAVFAYVIARQQLEEGHGIRARLNLFGAIPALVVAGLLSKQNAAVAPFICLAVELAYFNGGKLRPKPVQVFFVAFALIPALALGMLLRFSPERLLGGYDGWDFTLLERLLTQPRALCNYIGMWLVPRSPHMGLYTDDFPISTGFFSPVSTALAVAALVIAGLVAIRFRKASPTLFAGWFFFLAAHLVESSFLPIEMYYEHRNYLPSVGLLLAMGGVFSLLHSKIPQRWSNPRSAAQLALSGFVFVLAFATLGRVLVWQDNETLIEQGRRHHPRSLRAVSDASVVALWRKDYKKAEEAVAEMRASDQPRHRIIGNLRTIAVECLKNQNADPAYLLRAAQDAQPKLTVFEVHAAQTLVNITRAGNCGEVTSTEIADTFASLLLSAKTQSEQTDVKYAVRAMTAQMYARSGQWPESELHASLAWSATGHAPSGALLVNAFIHTGKQEAARDLLAELERKVRPFDTAGQQELRRLRKRLGGIPRG